MRIIREYFKHIILSLVGLGTIFLIIAIIFTLNEKTNSHKETNHYFSVIPHFMIDENKVIEFYEHLVKQNNLDKIKNLNIVLISPNHFKTGLHDYISSYKGKTCYQDDCIKTHSLIDNELIFNGDGKEKHFQSDYLFEIEKNTYSTKEHGIGEHFKHIKDHFDKSTKLYTLVINPYKTYDSDSIIDYLKKYFTGKNTLFIASVDFSHYVDEDYAWLHDKKTLYTLNNSTNPKDYDSIEVDCPNCLLIVNKMAYDKGEYPKLYYRDSSSLISGEEQGYNNTSRLFIEYNEKKIENNGITINFFGDLMYDRNVSHYLNSEEKFKERFSDFYMQGLTENNLSYFKHRKLFGTDFVGFNLETPVVKNQTTCQKTGKLVNFCSDFQFLHWLKELGFNIVNLANNHSMDAGIPAHKDTVKNLENEKIDYFGYVRHGKYLEENYISTGDIRGIKYAWHGYDFTITKNLIEDYCKILGEYKTNGYQNFVSVHWGLEYQTTHNITQEIQAKKLIDCGADLIIGHHPHVPQDIARYQNKPIIYSLGNFLFDQDFQENTKEGINVFIDYNLNGEITVLTGDVNAYYK